MYEIATTYTTRLLKLITVRICKNKQINTIISQRKWENSTKNFLTLKSSLSSGQLQGVLIIALVTLLGRKQKPQFEDIETCTKSGNADIEPKDYTGENPVCYC